ncbi:MAG TPA: GH25 family lysozyme [Fibrobacteria bacterium]|nr:GH25 family lysozyme [Fibrobacteria bacterium]
MRFPIRLASFRRRKWILLSLGLALVTASGLAWGVANGWLQVNNPSKTRFPHRGIDISHHQGHIDWKTVSGHHLDFVIAKATEGVDHQDRLFAEHARGALATGHKMGAYHFYRLCREGLPQARNFLRTIQGTPLEMGASLDLEYGGNCPPLGSRERTLREIQDFLDTVEAATGKPVMIYATPDFHGDWLEGAFPDNPLWIRSIWTEPRLEGRGWTLWQYAARGRLAGIEGFVDLNAMR